MPSTEKKCQQQSSDLQESTITVWHSFNMEME